MRIYRFWFVLPVMFFVTLPLCAQPFTVPFVASTAAGYADTIRFGLHPMATDCIDSVLGEYELPPCPPTGMFDMRFVAPHPDAEECFGQGVLLDVRGSLDSARCDTFHIRFQPGDNGLPVTFSWPGLAPFSRRRMTLQDPFGGVLLRINMRAQNSLTLWQSNLFDLVIIAGLPVPGSAPEGMTGLPHQVSYGHAVFTGTVIPHGPFGEAWFEYGSGTSLNNSTLHEPVGDGNLPVFLAHHTQDIYYGTYSYRIVVENEWGRTYGQTRSFYTNGASPGAQTMIGLTVSDSADHVRTLWAGIHPDASRCMDPELGEFFMPPLPPSVVFDTRFTDPHGVVGSCYDAGLGVDFRQQYPLQQADTFCIALQDDPANYPVRFSWSADLSGYISPSLRLMDAYGGLAVDVDMKTQQSVIVHEPALRAFRIIAGAVFQHSAPAVLTYPAQYVTGASAQFRGGVNPRGSPTQCRFEWGTSTSYGHTTAWQVVGGDTSLIGLAQTMLGLTTSTEYHFRVVAENALGTAQGPDQFFTTEATTDISDPSVLPAEFALFQNYPNPFNPTTDIRFRMTDYGMVTLKVYDVLGREVATLVNEVRNPGTYTVRWDASAAASGMYLYRLTAGTAVQTRRMALTR